MNNSKNKIKQKKTQSKMTTPNVKPKLKKTATERVKSTTRRTKESTAKDRTKSNKAATKKKPTQSKKKPIQKNTINQAILRLRQRLAIVGAFLLVAVIGLAINMARIAIINGEDYEREVYTRMVSGEKDIKALRGAIVDTNHKAIANSELVYHIIMDPQALLGVGEASRTRTYETLASYLERPTSEIEQIALDSAHLKYKIVQKSIPAEDMRLLSEEGLAGIWFEESFVRTYPKDELAAQLLGFYNGTKGQYGVEQYYDTYLQGDDGRVFPKIQDGNIITTEVKPAQTGDTLVLTIDEVIQQYVEQVMNAYTETYDPLHAASIVMNPNTGEIYAMYTTPGFNPNKYTTLEDQMGEVAWNNLELEEKSAALGRAWTNFNTQYPYEPGSTFKPMVIATGIEEGLLNLQEVYNCTGNNMVHGHNIQCWKRSGHGLQTLEQALANSCNTAMIQIVEDMPTEILYDYMVSFGLGEPTGIDLPAEARGIIHRMDTLGPVEKATSSIGQGFTLTPIQLMSAFSSVINGGYLVTPYVVSQVIDEEGRILLENEPQIKRQVISEETSDLLTEYMQSVVTYGTGTAAAIDGYNIGGKTGTAEKLPREAGEHIYSFVGYAPLENPEVIVLTLFDEIDEETGVPTKAFADIMDSVLPYMGIETSKEPSQIETGSATIPSVEGLELSEGIQRLYSEELDYEVIGIGSSIVEQYPDPGTKLPKGMQIKIYVETSNPEIIHEVPNIVGMSMSEAHEAIEGLFVLQGPSQGVVQTQIPKAGTKIEENSKIIVQTSE